MIVYGYRTLKTKSVPLAHETCPVCEAKGAMSSHFYSSYAHIFWIPVFPFKKYNSTRCGSCAKTFDDIIMETKPVVNHPFWTFSGLILVGAILIYFWLFD